MQQKQLALYLSILCLLFSTSSFAQSILNNTEIFCSQSHRHEHKMQTDELYRYQQERLEQQTFRWLSNKENRQKNGDDCIEDGFNSNEIAIIPVVIHILHASDVEPGDTDENPGDAQVRRAIQHLNDAFRNRGTYSGDGRGANDQRNPDRSLMRSQDTQIEFRLAQRDIYNQPTNGIIRYATDEYSDFDSNRDSEMKRWVARQNGDAFPTTDYASVYIVREICDGDPDRRSSQCGVAGYAYLAGSHGRFFDGILGEMRYFGNSTNGSKVYVHEFGHYLNLRHTFWGECGSNNCLASGDFVCDTPPDNTTSYTTCGRSQNTCENDTDAGFFTRDQDDMYENYMDYSDLRCQNTFTSGQKDRMRAALFGIRSSLLSSKGSIPVGSVLANIADITAPKGVACNSQIAPIVEINNTGDQAIRSLRIEYELDGFGTRSFNWNGNIPARATRSVQLPELNLNRTGNYQLFVQLANINGEAADATIGGLCQSFHYAPALTQLPYCEAVNTQEVPLEWAIENPDGQVGFEAVRIRGCEQKEKYALRLETWNQFPDQTTTDDLYLQSIDLRGYNEAYFDFDVAYATTFPNYNTILEIGISTDCGSTYQNVYRKTGDALASRRINAQSSTDENAAFVPSDCSDWKSQSVNLSAFAGQKILVRLRASTDRIGNSNVYEWGNNLYLDNFCLNFERCNAPNTTTNPNISVCGNLEVAAQVQNLSDDKAVFWWITNNRPITEIIVNQQALENAVGFTALGNENGLAGEGNILFRSNVNRTNLNIPVDCSLLPQGITFYATPVVLNNDRSNPFYDDCTFGRPVAFSCSCDATSCNTSILEVTVENAGGCGNGTGAITIRSNEPNDVEYSLDGENWRSSNRFDGLQAGTYQVFVRSTKDNSCTAQRSNITVQKVEGLNLSIANLVDPTCNAQDGVLEVISNNSNTQYRLNNGSWQDSNRFTNLAAGTYIIEVRDRTQFSCTASLTAVLTVSTTETITIETVETVSPTACDATDGELSISTTATGVEYSIDGGITWQDDSVFSNLSSGNYQPQIRRGDCAFAVGETVELLANGTGIEVAIAKVNDQVCLDEGNEFFFTILGGVAPYRVTYDVNGEVFVLEDYQSETIFTAIPRTAIGILNVQNVIDANGCSVAIEDRLVFFASRCTNNLSIELAPLRINHIRPNPFRTETFIEFEIAETQPLQLTIFDVTGRRIFAQTTLWQSGFHQWTINAQQLNQTAGVYYYTLIGEKEQVSGKLVLVE